MQVSDSTFICDSCEIELALEQQCDHPRTIHHWCLDCCENFEEYPRLGWFRLRIELGK